MRRHFGDQRILLQGQPSGERLCLHRVLREQHADDINQLFINGAGARLARYPNDGYAYADTVHSTTQMTSSDLDASANYVGATGVGRTSAFTRFSQLVTAQDGQRITIDEAPYLFTTDDVGAGFVLLDKLAFLDASGEWFYDDVTKTVYF